MKSGGVGEIEVDHSPSDGSQRGEKDRKEGEPLYYRPALPLPKTLHRRHKTTEGGKRLDRAFRAAQKAKVAAGNFHEALRDHLLETFSKEVIGNSGLKKALAVAKHAVDAIDYAASTNIGASIYPGHKANQPAIKVPQANAIKAALNTRWTTLGFVGTPF